MFKTTVRKWLNGAYSVGIISESADTIISSRKLPEIHWIKPKSDDTWFADPFIINVDDNKVYLLVEEFEHQTSKGRLSKITVDKNSFEVLEVEPILTLPAHLSFPYPVSHEGKTYICPESYQREEAALYEFTGSKCISPQRIISGKMLDTQIVEIPGKGWFAFSTRFKNGEMSDSKIEEIFHSESLFGPYTPFQIITREKCEGRGAGPIFKLSDGRLIRPAQNCEGGYGKGLIFFEITFENDRIEEREIARFDADESQKNGLCLHTFSPYGNIVAVDGFDYKSRTVAKLAPLIHNASRWIASLLKR